MFAKELKIDNQESIKIFCSLSKNSSLDDIIDEIVEIIAAVDKKVIIVIDKNWDFEGKLG